MDITKANSSFVVMDEAAITDSTADRYIIASGGAADCLIVAAYSTSQKWAYIVHATRSTDLRKVHNHILLFTASVDIHLSSKSFKDDPRNPLVAEIRDLFAHAVDGYQIKSESDTGKLAIDAKTGEVATDFNDKLCTFANAEMEAERSKPKAKADRNKYRVVEIPAFAKKPDSATPPPPEDPLVAEKKEREDAEKRKAQQEMMRKDLQIYNYGDSVLKVLSKMLSM